MGNQITVARVVKVFLALLVIYFLSLLIPPVWATARSSCSAEGLWCWGWVEAISLIGVFVTGLFAGVWVLTQSTGQTEPKPQQGTAFPAGKTVPVLLWLLGVFGVYIWTFMKLMVPETVDEDAVFWQMILDNQMIYHAAIAFLAAGIGAAVSTTFSYLSHASTQADWRDEHVPWYILRPIQGSVLGLIFYWLLKGGILAILPADAKQGTLELDVHTLAGACALVGMFSRRAMIKLRETFQVIFSTRDEEDSHDPLTSETEKNAKKENESDENG